MIEKAKREAERESNRKAQEEARIEAEAEKAKLQRVQNFDFDHLIFFIFFWTFSEQLSAKKSTYSKLSFWFALRYCFIGKF